MKKSSYIFNQDKDSRKILSLDLIEQTEKSGKDVFLRSNGSTSIIECVLRGRVIYYIGDDQTGISAKSGDTFICAATDKIHCKIPQGSDCAKISLDTKGPFLSTLLHIYNMPDVSLIKDFDCAGKLYEIMELAKKIDDDCFDKCAIIILDILQEAYNKKYAKEPPSIDPRALTLEKRINTYLDKNPTIDELSKDIKLSVSQATKIFSKSYGMSPYHYLIKRKIDMAKILLADTNLKIKEIASRLAFEDAYYFSRLFKQKTDMSPREYRNIYGSKTRI